MDSGVNGLTADEAVVPESGVRGLRASDDANRAAANRVEAESFLSVEEKPGFVKTTGGNEGGRESGAS